MHKYNSRGKGREGKGREGKGREGKGGGEGVKEKSDSCVKI